MALFMDTGSEDLTDRERDDLDAIAALKESAAIELKEQGNKYVKMGKKHYSDAIDCYSRAISQNSLSDSDQSVIFSNRAHVNLMLGNYRRALMDAEEAVRLCSTNAKAYYRAAKAALSLELLIEAESFCIRGLEQFPSNEEMIKLFEKIDSRKKECEHHKSKLSILVDSAKELVSALNSRGLKLGKPMYQELTGVKKPLLDKNSILYWPVLLLYPEIMSSDFIEGFCEMDIFSAHLDMMYSDNCSVPSWDKENAYTREAIELYYQAGCGAILTKSKVLEYFLQGTAASLFECGDNKDNDEVVRTAVQSMSNFGKWIKVNEKSTLNDILQQSDYIIPGIPVFFVVSKRTRFYNEFIAGNWHQP